MSVVLYPHQNEAVEWMRSTERRPRLVDDTPHGGILAHSMGLGKTLTMLSFIRGQAPGRTLVVCPKSLLLQWRTEAARVGWPPHSITIYHGAGRELPLPTGEHQIVLTTFDIVRLEFVRGRAMHTTTWDRIVLDEAHRICEQSSKTARTIHALRARNRWCITGTPFKNGMSDLMALARFLMVAPYCNVSWWRWYSNSASKLREWRRLFLHMRDKSVLDLPPMKHHFLTAVLSPSEVKLEVVLNEVAWKVRVDSPAGDEDASFTANHDQHELLRILRRRQAANHPMLLTPLAAMRRLMTVPPPPTPPHLCEACGIMPSTVTTCKLHARCATCGDEPMCAVCIAASLRTETPTGWLHSAKTRALWTYLRDVAQITGTDTKVVLFSQWTSCLDLLAGMLTHEGVGHARYDGRVATTDEREAVICHFRDTPSCQVLLTSLGAGGEGVNLTFASHVIIMEPYWNLAVEQQAIDRLHRIGQEKTTHVARLHVQDSVETWVRGIQTRKTNELQRLLYEKIMDDAPEANVKRTHPQRLRVAFEKVSGGEEHGDGSLAAFLVRPEKQRKLSKP